jgi:hypothetical protein
MYVLFTLLAVLPQLVADPSHSRWWTEIDLNIALVGAAWTARDLFSGPANGPLIRSRIEAEWAAPTPERRFSGPYKDNH